MQVYNEVFSSIYNLRFSNFVDKVFPKISDYYRQMNVSSWNSHILDLCCGTGQLAVHFLKEGYHVNGLDISEGMLKHARKNAEPFIQEGKAHFVKGDATDFKMDNKFGLVVSTYDSLNHLESEEALINCFKCVYNVLDEDGVFIFDLNTKRALSSMKGSMIHEDNNHLIMNVRQFDPFVNRASTRFSGFVKHKKSDYYVRFDQLIFNTVFDMNFVKENLLNIGWKNVQFSNGEDLNVPAEYPENEERVYIIAHK